MPIIALQQPARRQRLYCTVGSKLPLLFPPAALSQTSNTTPLPGSRHARCSFACASHSIILPCRGEGVFPAYHPQPQYLNIAIALFLSSCSFKLHAPPPPQVSPPQDSTACPVRTLGLSADCRPLFQKTTKYELHLPPHQAKFPTMSVFEVPPPHRLV